MNRKTSAPFGPPMREPMTTSIPPRPASRSVVRSAALKLERLVVVISWSPLGELKSVDEYTEAPQRGHKSSSRFGSSRSATFLVVTTTKRRRERQEWNPDLGVLASQLNVSLQDELFARLAADGLRRSPSPSLGRARLSRRGRHPRDRARPPLRPPQADRRSPDRRAGGARLRGAPSGPGGPARQARSSPPSEGSNSCGWATRSSPRSRRGTPARSGGATTRSSGMPCAASWRAPRRPEADSAYAATR